MMRVNLCSLLCLWVILLGIPGTFTQINFGNSQGGGLKFPNPLTPRPKAPSTSKDVTGCNCLSKQECPSGFGQLQNPCVTERGDRGICCIAQNDLVLTRVGFFAADFVPMNIADNVIDTGFEMGEQFFSQIMEDERTRLRNREFLVRGDPARGHAFFFQRRPSAQAINDLAYTIAQSSKEIAELESLTPTQSFLGLPEFKIGSGQMGFQCPLNDIPNCDANSKYRTIDGSCNNLRNPILGKSETGFGRLRPALYDDGIMEPRMTGVDGRPLPNVRDASNTVYLDVDIPDSDFTLGVMQWAQFMDHDLTHAPFDDMGGEAIRCCSNGQIVSPLPVPCFPIEISPNDGFYGPRRQRCINFVRSMLALNDNCALGPVEQLNVLTHWVDGSMIYGSTDEEAESVNDFSTGFMRTSGPNNDLPPTNRSVDCDARAPNSLCFVGGDTRINEQPALTVMHTLWIREHNRIARILKSLNPQWNARKLFEETRRIVAAEVQHITYKEWLPIIIGKSLMNRLRINALDSGFRSSYNPSIDPRTSSEFATAAFRFGHSLIQGLFKLISNTGRLSTALLRDVFNAPHLLQENPSLMESFVNSLTLQNIQTLDNFISQELSNHLFQTTAVNFGMDLMSLNLQRGREHAISTYNQMREDFGHGRASNFLDLQSSTAPDLIRRIQAVYRNIDDVDLFIGGMTETPLRDALLGPTFANIIGKQFQSLLNGDRFFYDMGGQAGSFTPAQLQEVRKSSISRIYCDNTEVPQMQPRGFISTNTRTNPRVSCTDTNSIPAMDLSVFKE